MHIKRLPPGGAAEEIYWRFNFSIAMMIWKMKEISPEPRRWEHTAVFSFAGYELRADHKLVLPVP